MLLLRMCRFHLELEIVANLVGLMCCRDGRSCVGVQSLQELALTSSVQPGLEAVSQMEHADRQAAAQNGRVPFSAAHPVDKCSCLLMQLHPDLPK
jgi:hypothetical protein